MKVFRTKTDPADSRRYYEVFGDTVVMLNTFKLVTLLLSGIVFFQVYVNLKAQNKEPIVIRVDQVGRAEAVRDAPSEREPDEIQIQAFTKDFIETFTSYDSKSIEHDFAKALNMMHSDYQKRAREELLGSKLLSQLKEENLHSRVRIQEIRIEKNVPGWVKLWAAGIRRIESSLDPAFSKETLFNAYLTLAKVPRTVKEPYGLLVYDYREHLMKEISPQGGVTDEA